MKSTGPDFSFSQPANETDQPLAHTGSPRDLFFYDAKLFFRNILYLPCIFWPLYPWGSGRLDELYPSAVNLIDIALHSVLTFAQLSFLISLPFMCYFPTVVLIAYISLFVGLNALICWHFNRAIPAKGLVSKEDEYSRGWEKHDDEAWIFLNGICVGQNWLQNNIDRISRTFHRPVVGIHNPTYGVVFDIIQCLIQRVFSYVTLDARACYVLVKAALYRDDIKKVVLILHSQGGIEGGMIIDWLLDEVPQDILFKLEVYTFGCLANHFSNPSRRRHLSEHSTNSLARHLAPTQPTNSYASHRNAISHIEHYANSLDFACRWGVLNFTDQDKPAGGKGENRFMGRLFVNPRSGHQLNQHYLDSMFPLDPTLNFVREPIKGDFMDQKAPVESYRKTNGVNGDHAMPNGSTPQSTHREGYAGVIYADSLNGERTTRALKMKNMSRLWQYRNGRVPVEDVSQQTPR